MTTAYEFEAASALSKGRRSYQEDAIISDFTRGADVGMVVLADGMGGHAAGDVASKIVVTEVFSELIFHRSDPESFEPVVTITLNNAAMAANACLRDHVAAYPDTLGMGATLVACVIVGENLYWISIGDSPLYLFRDGSLIQLNEDHSMAPQIDFMAKSGLMAVEDALTHPDRNVLTSVLFGKDVPRIDCPDRPKQLRQDDILIVASDGLQFLTNDEIETALQRNWQCSSGEIVDDLMDQIDALDDPDLDNVSLSVIKLNARRELTARDACTELQSGIRRVG